MAASDTGSMVQLTASDGHRLDCWIQPAVGERKGGIVILQEIFGVTEQLKSVALRYAALGYEVAIPALFDRWGERGTVVPFDQGPVGGKLMQASDPNLTILDIAAAVSALKAKGELVAVIGFCWGGGLAIKAAQELDISGAVAFYGTRLPQYLGPALKAPVLYHWGKTDGHVPEDMIEQAKTQYPEMQVYTYEAGHAFANDARPDMYDAESAERAHARTEEFLARNLAAAR